MELHGKIALVTGASGTVGSKLVHRLASEGMKVRAMVRKPEPYPELEGENIELVRGDLTAPDSLIAAAKGAHLLVHTAAVIGSDPVATQKANVEGIQNILTAAVKGGCEKFIQISSIVACDGRGYEKLTEDVPLWSSEDGYGAYWFTKAEAERTVWKAHQAGLPVVVLRPSGVLSIHAQSYWGPRTIKQVARGRNPIPIEPFPYVHVDNLVDAILLAAKNDKAVGQAYNITDGHVTRADYLNRIRRGLGMEPLELPDPQSGEVPYIEVPNEKAREQLGWKPADRYAEAMAEVEALAADWKEKGVIVVEAPLA